MKCPSCGRLMLNLVTYLKCSNGYCDYEEDVEPQVVPVKPMQLSVKKFSQACCCLDSNPRSPVLRLPDVGCA
jgi:hypothetical protein